MQNAVHQVSSADTNLATLQETSLPDDAALFSIEVGHFAGQFCLICAIRLCWVSMTESLGALFRH